MKLGLIADDNTGATDAAGMLTERGVRTVLALDADCQLPLAAIDGFEAFVVGTQNRSVAPAAAARATRFAIGLLQGWGADRFQVKYCSTFDSTREGNIGPSLDAALDALATRRHRLSARPCPSTIAPFTRGISSSVRGCCRNRRPRKHPLNPMTDANIVRWLGYQTSKKVGLTDLSVVRLGSASHEADAGTT